MRRDRLRGFGSVGMAFKYMLNVLQITVLIIPSLLYNETKEKK
jgi:hypothetical protein